jgi:dTDP-glucose pyrophosphorylase
VFSIIDVYLELASGSQVNAMPFLGNYWIDVGKPQNLAAAAEILKRMHNLP